MKHIIFSISLMFLFCSTIAYSQNITFTRISPATVRVTTQPPGYDTLQVKSFAVVHNTTSSGINVDMVISNVVRSPGWGPGGLCNWVTCYPESLYVIPTTVAAPGYDTIDVYFSPHFALGSASCRVTVSFPGGSTFQDFGFAVDPIGIQQISSIVKDFSLGQNYPNPFNPNTKINFSIPKAEYAFLRVYDILGREVKTLVAEQLQAGEYQVDFDAKDLASGMYYYSLRAGENVTVKKMVLVK